VTAQCQHVDSFSAGGPVAIYRDDLASDYAAYWMVEFNSSQYIVVSSGPETGMLAVIRSL